LRMSVPALEYHSESSSGWWGPVRQSWPAGNLNGRYSYRGIGAVCGTVRATHADRDDGDEQR
jgi:hypothetical protein